MIINPLFLNHYRKVIDIYARLYDIVNDHDRKHINNLFWLMGMVTDYQLHMRLAQKLSKQALNILLNLNI